MRNKQNVRSKEIEKLTERILWINAMLVEIIHRDAVNLLRPRIHLASRTDVNIHRPLKPTVDVLCRRKLANLIRARAARGLGVEHDDPPAVRKLELFPPKNLVKHIFESDSYSNRVKMLTWGQFLI